MPHAVPVPAGALLATALPVQRCKGRPMRSPLWLLVALFPVACSDSPTSTLTPITGNFGELLNGTYELTQFSLEASSGGMITEKQFSTTSHVRLKFGPGSEVTGEGYIQVLLTGDTLYFIGARRSATDETVIPLPLAGWHYMAGDTLEFRLQRKRGEGTFVETLDPPVATQYLVAQDRSMFSYTEPGLSWTFRKIP
jgi:hypothetical protein